MLTQAPLPTWSNLFSALLRCPSSDIDLAAPWRRGGEVAGWLSRSAWSLALIAQWRQNCAPASPVTVWIPDFFCNTSLVFLRQTGVKLLFYPLTDNTSPDFTVCRVLAEADPPDIFVLVHYFGQPKAAANARDFSLHYGAWLIEDAAHVLRPVNNVGVYGDFVIYSPHKHLPIPDGAVLLVRPNGPSKFGAAGVAPFGLPSSWVEQLDKLQQQMGCPISDTQIQALVWFLKRLLQKFGIRPWYKPVAPFIEPLITPIPTVNLLLIAPSMSSLARNLLAGLISDLGAVARQRLRHQLLWDDILLLNDKMCTDIFSVTKRPLHRGWTPYLAAYKVDPTVAETTYNHWQRHGLPVTTWPDLPPEVLTHKENHVNAWELRHSLFYLPVHQSLSAHRMLKQLHLQKTIQKNGPRLKLVWNGANQNEWQQWMLQVGRSNLLQSWAYGEAKSVQGNWRVKRGVFYLNNEPVALVQVLQKGLPGFLALSRINRGPLYLRSLLPHEQRAVWDALAHLGNLWHGQILIIAPELTLSGSSLILMENLGFRQFSPQAWESVWADLGLDLDALRKRLDGKWRNMLAFSEKAGLKLEISSNYEQFNWMMDQQKRQMKEKNFNGLDPDFLMHLYKHADVEEPLLILRALYEGEPVAGICIACHGVSATYLVGWNGPKGRNLKANQFLLWQALVYLKHSGYCYLDLGGIDEEHTPGIAAFKLGLNGERYELVGEYWKC
jgi:hypothetical protein